MKAGAASATAISAAAMRAAHLHLFDAPWIHEDTFALQLVGFEDAEQLRTRLQRHGLPALRRVAAYFALRHRFAEDRLQAALDRGVAQVVLLGAGLDTLALRRPEIPRAALFVEVDHPASQQWKLKRLEELGLQTPRVRYLSVDFGTQDLAQELRAFGVDVRMPVFFAWLGVTQYISRAACLETLSLVARHARGSEVVFDTIRPLEGLTPDEHIISATARDSSSERDEPWISYFEPAELELLVSPLGFAEITHLSLQSAASYYDGQPPSVSPLSAWVLHAAVV